MKTDSEKEKKLSFALNKLKSLNLQNPTLKSNLESAKSNFFSFSVGLFIYIYLYY